MTAPLSCPCAPGKPGMGVFLLPHHRARRKSAVRKRVAARDGGICQVCGLQGGEVHHVQPICFGGADEPDNAVVLCEPCHKEAPDDWREFLPYQRSGGTRLREMVAKNIGEGRQLFPGDPLFATLQNAVDHARHQLWGIPCGFGSLYREFEEGVINAQQAVNDCKAMIARTETAIAWIESIGGNATPSLKQLRSCLSGIREDLNEYEATAAQRATCQQRALVGAPACPTA
jgi:hypothetical protein